MFHQTKHGHDYTINSFPTSKPRALVVLLGWVGAKPRTVQKYAQEIYAKRNVGSIVVVASTTSIMLRDQPSLDQCALRLMIHAASALRLVSDGDNNDNGNNNALCCPILVHAFSNGGGYVLERMEKMIQQERAKGKAGDPDVLLFGSRMQGQIFDSAPALGRLENAKKALWQAVSNNPFLYWCGVLVLLAQICQDWIVRTVWNRSKPMYLQNWDHMRLSTLCLNQAYVFSAADEITAVKPLEELIAIRQANIPQSCVLVKKFDDSDHVSHWKKHPVEYEKVVDDLLNVAAPTSKSSTKT